MAQTLICRQVREGLREYLDGAAPLDGSVALEGHLRSCSACAVQVRELRRTTALLSSMPMIGMPASMKARLLEGLRKTRPS